MHPLNLFPQQSAGLLSLEIIKIVSCFIVDVSLLLIAGVAQPL